MIEYKKNKDAERQQALEQEQADKISKQRNRLKRVRESEFVWSVQKMRRMVFAWLQYRYIKLIAEQNDGTKKKDNKSTDDDDSKHLLDDYESEEDESIKLEDLDKKGLKALYGIIDSDDEEEKDLTLLPETEEEKNNFQVRKVMHYTADSIITNTLDLLLQSYTFAVNAVCQRSQAHKILRRH